MITKTGSGLVSVWPALVSGSTGAIRASRLSDDDRELLGNEYDLPSDASFVLRNAGRGVVGGAAGTVGGIAAAVPLGIGSLSSLVAGHPGLAGVLGASAAVAPLVGFAYGTKKMTDKYSKGNVSEIRKGRG